LVDAFAIADCPLAAARAARLVEGGCCEVVTIALTTRSRTPGALGFGTALSARATTPATWGAAIDVPSSVAKAPTLVDVVPGYPVGTVDVTPSPGAATNFKSLDRPARFENDATVWLAFTAPTASTPEVVAKEAGNRGDDSPELPAATTTMAPSAVACLMALVTDADGATLRLRLMTFAPLFAAYKIAAPR